MLARCPYEADQGVMMTVGTTDMIAGTELTADSAGLPSVSTTYLQGVVDFGVRCGLSARALLLRAGIGDADLADAEARYPVDTLIALLRAGAELTSDPAFALHFGLHVPCDQVSLAAPLGRSATNVADALEIVNRYAPLTIDFPACRGGDRYAFATDRAGLWLCDNRPADSWQEITELVFARMVQGIRRIQRTDVVRAVYVRHAAPAHRCSYDEVFGVPVHFGSGRNAMLLDPSYLLTDLTPGPSHVTRILAAHANAQLAELEKRKSCRGRLEVELRKVLHTGNVGIAQVTRRLSMTATRVWLRSGCGKALFESLNQRTSKQSLRR